ncbi:restriction endonuclease subunit S [Lactobacillus delbrueckii subsp. lactis]|uniref:restriction endonuclease subunit S n=1 Tax=Lactobacillus delbrueckii TaxID=1584 RepID=UPI001E641EBF|nr:restriction endonuclease subunit S [Lactobacillus delbrueckii]MCD5435726.1 restriction endonuclease subunit S [Lactobacillus delbrueckii subsp. lactis]
MKDEKKAPKLRFKGFTDDWEQRKLGDVCEEVSGNNGNVKGLPILTISAANGWMNQKDRFSQVIAGNELKKYTLLEKGHLAYNHGNSKLAKYGTVFVQNLYDQALVPRVYHSFKMKTENNPYYVEYYFATKKLDRELARLVTSGARMDGLLNINKKDFFKIKFEVPTPVEQSLISTILQKLDQIITLHEEKKRQLERLKSALLQKMFADKSGYPAVRFKGFDDIWDQEKLNSLVRLHRGLTYSPNNVQDSGIRILRSSNILDGQFVMTDDDIFVKSSVVNIPTVKDGDILITAANGSIKLVGKHAIISGISENTAVSGGFMLVGSSRIPDFVNSLFDTSWYQRFIRKYVTGGNGSIGNLKKNDLDKQYVKVPTTSEQERIGEFFREIDQLIINNQIKHEKLLELKKFLLQNMFI